MQTDANNGVWISPTGILGKKAGSTTFAITNSGDATFKGTIAAGSVIAANISASNITAGTFTGFTIQTAASGARCVITSSNGYQFYYDGNFKGKILADNTQGIIYDTNGSSHYFRSGGTEYAQINSNGILIPNASAYYISSGSKMSYTGGYLKFEGASGGDVGTKFQGSVSPNRDNAFELGQSSLKWSKGWFEDISVDDLTVNSTGSITIAGNSGDDEEFEVATSFEEDGGSYYWKARLMTFKKGVLTNLGDESSWREIT